MIYVVFGFLFILAVILLAAVANVLATEYEMENGIESETQVPADFDKEAL